MRRRFGLPYLVALLLVAAPGAWATAYTASVTGDWNSSATWGGAGIPVSGDTCSISSGITVTVPSGYTATVGTSGVTGTVACTVAATGALTNSGTLVLQGDLTLAKGSTFTNAGVLEFNPPDAATYMVQSLSTGSGTAHFIFNTGSSVTSTLQGTTGGYGYFDAYTNTSSADFTFYGGTFTNCGSATQYCIKSYLGTGQNFIATSGNATVFNGTGVVYLRIAVATNTFDFENVSFINCADTSTSTCLYVQSTVAATTGTRYMANITAYNLIAKEIDIYVGNFKCGKSVYAGDSSNVPCVIGYNTRLFGGYSYALNNTLSSSFLIMDSLAAGTSNVAMYSYGNNYLYNTAFMAHVPNQHEITETPTGTTGVNTAAYNVCDGDGYKYYDVGDFTSPALTQIFHHNIGVNSCGTMFSLAYATTVFSAYNNTQYNSQAGAVGETNGSAVQLTMYRNNLVVNPMTYLSGVEQRSAFVTQTMAADTFDYNAFYGTMDAANLTNATLGGVTSYAGPETYSTWFTSSTYGTTTGYGTHDLHVSPNFKDATRTFCTWYNAHGGAAPCSYTGDHTATTGTTTTAVYCSTCNFTTMGLTTSDWIGAYSSTGTYLGRSQIASVDSATQLTLSSAITSLTTGSSVTVITSTMNLARELVKLNGVDYTGATATPSSWATQSNAMAYIREGLTPRSSALKSSGYGSTYIGAIAPVSGFIPTSGVSDSWR